MIQFALVTKMTWVYFIKFVFLINLHHILLHKIQDCVEDIPFVGDLFSLLSDAKIPKNISQNLVGRNLSDDAAEVVDCFADVLGGEVGR